MRILWLSHIVPYPPAAGNVIRSWNLIRGLAESHEVHLLALRQKALLAEDHRVVDSRDALLGVCRSVRFFERQADRSGWHRAWLHLTNLARRNPYSVQGAESSALRAAITRAMADLRPDVVHFDTIDLACYADLAQGTRRILNHHNVESNLLERRAAMTTALARRQYLRWQARKLRRFEARMIGAFDCNLVVSDPDRQRLKELCPGCRVEIVPNGVDTDYFRPSNRPVTPNSLVFTGSLEWFPNYDAAVYMVREIWPLIRTRLPDATLTFVGSPGRARPELGGTPGVRFVGHVEDVRPWLWEASVVIVPLRVGGGTRLKILDSWACGKAVVSTRIGWEGLRGEPGEHLLEATCSTELADKAIHLCVDTTARMELEAAARAHAVLHYDWSLINRGLLKLLSSPPHP